MVWYAFNDVNLKIPQKLIIACNIINTLFHVFGIRARFSNDKTVNNSLNKWQSKGYQIWVRGNFKNSKRYMKAVHQIIGNRYRIKEKGTNYLLTYVNVFDELCKRY